MIVTFRKVFVVHVACWLALALSTGAPIAEIRERERERV